MRQAFYSWVAVLFICPSAVFAQPATPTKSGPEARPEGKAAPRPEGRAKSRPGAGAKPRPEDAKARPRPEARPVTKVKGGSPKDKAAGKPATGPVESGKKRRVVPLLRRRRRGRRRFRRWLRRMLGKRKPFEMRWGRFTIRPVLQLQVQGVAFVGKDALYENGDPATDEGLLIRRARLGFEGRLPWNFEYSLLIEAFGDVQRGSNGQGLAGENRGAQLLDASISWAKYKMLRVGVGSAKAPGAKGRMVSSTMLQLVERPFVIEEFAVDRRAGVWVGGDFKYFTYHVGFFNGDTGLNFGNEGGGYMAAARLEVTPLGSMGESRSDFLRKRHKQFKKPRLSAGVSFQYQHGPTVDRMALSGDLAFKWYGFSFSAEALYVREDPLEDPTQTQLLPELNEGLGVYAQAGYFILPGRLEVAARFEYMDPNFDIDDARDFWAVSGGVNYHWTRFIRAQLAYTHKEEMNHAQVENDSFVLQMQVAF